MDAFKKKLRRWDTVHGVEYEETPESRTAGGGAGTKPRCACKVPFLLCAAWGGRVPEHLGEILATFERRAIAYLRRRPISAARAPLLLIFAALDCWCRPFEGHSNARTNEQDLRSVAGRRRRVGSRPDGRVFTLRAVIHRGARHVTCAGTHRIAATPRRLCLVIAGFADDPCRCRASAARDAEAAALREDHTNAIAKACVDATKPAEIILQAWPADWLGHAAGRDGRLQEFHHHRNDGPHVSRARCRARRRRRGRFRLLLPENELHRAVGLLGPARGQGHVLLRVPVRGDSARAPVREVLFAARISL